MHLQHRKVLVEDDKILENINDNFTLFEELGPTA